MAPITFHCPGGVCQYETPELEPDIAAQVLRIHTDAAHVGQVGNVHQPIRPEKVRRPQLVVKEGFVTENRWLFWACVERVQDACGGYYCSEAAFVFLFGGGGVNVTPCQVLSGKLQGSDWGWVNGGRKGDGGKDEEQVGDAAAVKEDIAGPGSTSTDILSKFEIYCKDYALMIYVLRPWTILMPWCSNNWFMAWQTSKYRGSFWQNPRWLWRRLKS